MRRLFAASLFLAIAACGQAAAPDAADAQTQNASAFTDADRAAILAAIGLSAANAQGQVMNECGELVTPQYLPAELGGDAGTAMLFAIGGGPNMASCYGDGSLLHLMVRDGAGWRDVYSDRGGMLIILPTSTQGVHDIADGGPGFSFPLWQWNGRVYAAANREIADSELNGATFLP